MLPVHVSYSEAHARAASEWGWAVGSSALAHTSRGAGLGQMQLDVSARNQLAAAMHGALEELDAIVRALRETRLSARSRHAARRPGSAAHRALVAVQRVRAVLRVVAELAGELALGEAHAALVELDAELARARAAAIEALDEAEPHACADVNARALGATPRGDEGAWALVALMMAGAAGLYAAFIRTPARAKPKLN